MVVGSHATTTVAVQALPGYGVISSRCGVLWSFGPVTSYIERVALERRSYSVSGS